MNKTTLCEHRQGPELSRRQWLERSTAGFGVLAMRSLLAEGAMMDKPKSGMPHYPARAKRVIFLFMHGGPSHIDTFDYKPLLKRDHGKPLPFAKPRVQFAQTGNLLASPWEFKQYGQSGRWVSELFPQVARHSDQLCVIKSIHGSNEAHGGALLKMHTGSDTFVRPSMGAWVSYGLGTENRNLPAFITIHPTLGHGGVQNFGAAFLPAQHQGVRIGHRGADIRDVGITNLKPALPDADEQASDLAYLDQLNRLELKENGPNTDLEARIESFELAFRMQMEAPPLFDVSKETEATRKLYGIDQEGTDGFGRQCLLAARMSEAGVRFVQCSHGYWDQHSNLEKDHARLAREVDQPIAGLLKDLAGRGLLEDTLVMWGGEFGRTPTAQGKDGRDHNPHAFTWWFAGGGVRPGFEYGLTDDYGYYTADQRVHVHDLHATLLHLLGMDHERLTYRYGGRDFRLTDIAGEIVHPILG
ncbi:MAG: DUF1501 domain-containing protein [Verrucomicrobia bacterium]|nr:DUF1501 domain-containing protein [Verrucomicrobiota bacterium]